MRAERTSRCRTRQLWLFVLVLGLAGCATPHEKLSKALDSGDAETVRTILRSDLTSQQAATVLWRRARTNDTRSVQKLLDASVSIEEDGTTALIAAAGRGNIETVKLLLERGAPIDYQEAALIISKIVSAGSKDGEPATLQIERRRKGHTALSICRPEWTYGYCATLAR